MEYTISIALACTLAGALIGCLTFIRGKSKDDRGEGRQTGVILTELGYIKSSVENLNSKFERAEERDVDFAQRLSAVEESARSAHRRLDHIEGMTE